MRPIFVFQIQVILGWVRKRAFDYMEQGVTKMGEDLEAAKKVIDEIKVRASTDNLINKKVWPLVEFADNFVVVSTER